MKNVLEQKRLFRTSLNGFRKEDVNRYIAELSQRYAELAEKIQHVEQERDLLRGERDEARSKTNSLTEELAKQQERLASLQSGNDVLMEKARLHFEEKARASREEEELRNRLAELEQRIPELENRAQRYEQESTLIGQTLIDARQESERIRNAAQDTARLVHQQLQQEISRVAASIDDVANSYQEIQAGTQRYSEQMRTMMETLLRELQETRSHINSLDAQPYPDETSSSEEE